MAHDFDVAVVGGGPAGAVAARALALHGRSVCLVEREVLPRYKTCGGGLVGRALRELERELGIDTRRAAERDCRAVELNLLDAGLAFRVERAAPLVRMTMRAELDALLCEAACAAGVELRAGCALEGLYEARDSILLRTTTGTLRARYVVGCDGALSGVAKTAGFAPLPRSIPALECELTVAPELFERFASSARFDFGALEHGYAWVFPKRAHLSVGCLSTRRGARELRAELARYLALLGLSRFESRADHGFLIPIAPRPGAPARGRVFLCGDALGLADPVTCEGISNAVHSARLAADAIAARFESPARARRRYRRSLAREIFPELRRARRLASLVYDHPRLRSALFRRVGSGLCEAMADVVAGDATYSRLLQSPRRVLRAGLRLVAPRAPRAVFRPEKP